MKIINKAFPIVTNAQHFENRQDVCDDIFLKKIYH